MPPKTTANVGIPSYGINMSNANANMSGFATTAPQSVATKKAPIIQTTSQIRAQDTSNIQKLDTALQRKSAAPVQQYTTINGYSVPVSGATGITQGQEPDAVVQGRIDAQKRIDEQRKQQEAQAKAAQTGTSTTTTSSTTTSTRTPEQDKMYSAYSDVLKDLEQQKSKLTSEYDSLKARASAENQLLMDTIKSKFERLRNKMIDSNSRLLAQVEKNQYTSDAFRYTPNQAAGTLYKSEQEGIDRLKALDEEENNALIQAANAKSKGDYDALSSYLGQVDKINQDRLNVLKEQSDIALQIDKTISDSKTVTKDGAIAPKTTKDQIDVAENLAPFLLSQIAGMDTVAQENFFKSQAEKFSIPVELLKSATEGYKTERSDKAKTAKTTSGTKLTESERKANTFSAINQIIDNQIVDNKTGVPYVDANGFFTPVGFKSILKAALEDGLSKKEVLQEYGQYLYLPDIDNYGLTDADKKTLGISDD